MTEKDELREKRVNDTEETNIHDGVIPELTTRRPALAVPCPSQNTQL